MKSTTRLLVAALLMGGVGACGGSSLNNSAESPGTPATAAYASATPERAAVSSLATSLSAQNAGSSSAYKIGPLDVLEIKVFKVPELSQNVQVSEAGSINYPLIGEFPVAGKSAREIEQSLTKTLGSKFLKNPQVSVFVREFNSQRVTIQGSVNKPGIYPIQGRMSLIQLMAVSGGLDQVSDDSVVIFRTSDGQKSVARYSVQQVQSGSTPDPQLQAGDIVVAGKSAFKEGFNNILKALPITSMFMLL